MSGYHGDWANRQEPVYNSRGEVVGCVAPNGPQWVAADVDGRRCEAHSTRRQAEQAVLGWARGPQVARRPQQAPQQAEVSFDQVVGAVAAGAALLAGLGALFGDQGQPRANDAADELRRQNDELRRQNDLLRQALGGLGNQGITKRR